MSNDIHSSGSELLLGVRRVRVDAERGSIILGDQDERVRPRVRESWTLLPRRGRNPVGRDGDLLAIVAALDAGRAVEIVGSDGIGKSTVLRALAYALADSGMDVIYLDAAERDVEDVVQDLFEACYDSSGYLPDDAELRGLMTGVAVRVLIDDLSCSAERLRALLAVVPDAAVVWTAARPSGIGAVVELDRLPLDAARELLAAELGDSAPAVVETIWRACAGHPLKMLRVAALAREAGRLPGQDPNAVIPVLVRDLGPVERDVLAFFATFPAIAVSGAVFAEIRGDPEAATVCTRLVELGLLAESNGQFRLSPGVAAYVPRDSRLEDQALEVVAARLISWLTGARPRVAAGQVNLCTTVIETMTRTRPELAVRTARAAAPVLARSVRAGGWRRVLDAGHAAAERAGDRSAAAYFRHESGIRSLGLGDQAAAAAQFTAAAALWQQAGDSVGAGITLQAQALAPASAAPGVASASTLPAAVTVPVAATTGAAAATAGATSAVTATVVKIAAICVLVPGAAYVGNEYVAPCLVTNMTSSPAEVLADAVTTLDTTSYRFSGELGPVTIEGVTDPRAKAVQATMTVSGEKVDARVIGNDLYIGAASGPAAGQWMHLAVDQLGIGSPYEAAAKPASSAAFLSTVSGGEGSIGCRYTGQVDLAKLADPEQPVAQTAPGALLVPFEAELDNEERLTSVKITLPPEATGGASLPVTTRMWDYGTETRIDTPQGNVVEAPPEAYGAVGP